MASLIVSVTGLLVVDDSPNPLQFSQVFHLIPDGGGYYVYVLLLIHYLSPDPSLSNSLLLLFVGSTTFSDSTMVKSEFNWVGMEDFIRSMTMY